MTNESNQTSKDLTPADDNGKSKSHNEVILRDLQSLLRKKMGDQLIVVSYSTDNLLPPGENYGSTMLKVEAKIKRTKDSPEEDMHLVAKAVPSTEFQKAYMDVGPSVTKECFVHEKLSAAFRELERDAGVDEDLLINIWPKFYGGRLTMNEKTPDVADDDAVFVMGNLREQGYGLMDRIKGLDLEHAKLATKTLARFHALGMVLRLKRPDFFEEVKKTCNVVTYRAEGEGFKREVQYAVKSVFQDPRIGKYVDRIKASFRHSKNFADSLKIETPEQWISIIHGDYWLNNIMFHHDENDKLDGIKIVDYQLTRTSSPMKDLPYFMCANFDMDVMDNHFHEMIDYYYESLIGELEKLDHDTSLLTRENFDEQFKEDAKTELPYCILSLKFFTNEMNPDELDLEDIKSAIMMSEVTDTFLERTWRMIKAFAEKGWI